MLPPASRTPARSHAAQAWACRPSPRTFSNMKNFKTPLRANSMIHFTTVLNTQARSSAKPAAAPAVLKGWQGGPETRPGTAAPAHTHQLKGHMPLHSPPPSPEAPHHATGIRRWSQCGASRAHCCDKDSPLIASASPHDRDSPLATSVVPHRATGHACAEDTILSGQLPKPAVQN